MQSTTLGQLAEDFGLELHGPESVAITGLATLAGAGPADLGFLANPAYRDDLKSTRAGGVLVSPENRAACPVPALVTSDPYLAWARIAEALCPPPAFKPGVHPSAAVDPDARVDPRAGVGAQVTIGPGCHVQAGAWIGPGCVLDRDVSVGPDCRLVGRVWIGPGVQLGARVLIHPGAVVGADGFGLVLDKGRWRKVPQLGTVEIGDDCEIGANTTIDAGAIENTVLAEDVRLDNQVQIAHNVRIGAHSALAGCVGVAGSTRIGSYCMIAGASGIGGHLEICDKVVITAMSTVLDSITEPGHYGSGIPARKHREWQRILIRLGRLDDMARRLLGLERNIPTQPPETMEKNGKTRT